MKEECGFEIISDKIIKKGNYFSVHQGEIKHWYKESEGTYNIWIVDEGHLNGIENDYETLEDAYRQFNHLELIVSNTAFFRSELEKLKLSEEANEYFDDVRYLLCGELELYKEDTDKIEKALELLKETILKDMAGDKKYYNITN